MVIIPKNLVGEKLISFLMANKSELIAQKCAFPIKSEGNNYPYITAKKSKVVSNKAAGEQAVLIDDNGELDIVAIANAANFIDTQMDMLLPDCWKKTIKESGPTGKNRIYHLKDHNQKIDGVIGKINNIYSQDYSLTDLGLSMIGTTQCLVMESTVKEALNDKCFDMYSSKMINQHSIGLQYVKMDIAVNDPNYPAEFAVWNKYYSQVINKDVANKCGYFWVIYEIKLLEVSAVLWGANELTPCVDDMEEKENDVEIDSTKTKEKSISMSEMISKATIKIEL